MNRHQRRADAAQKPASDRQATLVAVVDFLAQAAVADSTITGITLLRPDGEVIYLSAAQPSQVVQ